jgi:hypothetical protein
VQSLTADILGPTNGKTNAQKTDLIQLVLRLCKYENDDRVGNVDEAHSENKLFIVVQFT